MNILSRFSSLIKSTKKDQTKKEILDTFVILPESVRYALRYKGAKLGRDEIQSLLDSSFGICGPYMMMKFCDNDIAMQSSILSILVAHYDDYSAICQKLSGLCAAISSSHTVQGHKAAILSQYNFHGLDSRAQVIAQEIYTQKQKPILLLYAGLLLLPSFLKSYQGEHIRLFNPKNPTHSFLLQKQGDHRTLSQEVIKDITQDYVLVDDLYKTGKTYDKALAVLCDLGYDKKLELYSAVQVRR